MKRIGRKAPAGAHERLRQVVDWSSAVWAGLAAGAVFLVVNLFLMPAVVGGNGWVFLRIVASLVLGHEVLAPPATFDGVVLVVALLMHFGISIGFGLLVSIVVYRGGLLGGILVGGLLGAALYGIDVYGVKYALPWLYTYIYPSWIAGTSGWLTLGCHVLFGMTAGGVYEGLEVEEWEAAESPGDNAQPMTKGAGDE